MINTILNWLGSWNTVSTFEYKFVEQVKQRVTQKVVDEQTKPYTVVIEANSFTGDQRAYAEDLMGNTYNISLNWALNKLKEQ